MVKGMKITKKEACALGYDLKKSECEFKDGWIHMGTVAVDSGQMIIADPTYICEPSWEKYYDDVSKKTIGGHFGYHNLGVAFRSGFGDGGYPVYGKIKDYGKGNYRISEIRVKMIDDDENEKLDGKETELHRV